MTPVLPPLPWHVVGGPPAPRRLLLVSYHFPPSRAVGALRWRKLLSHLPAGFAAVDVLAADPRALAAQDASGLADLPSGVRIFGIATPTLARDRLTTAVSRGLHVLRRLRPPGGGNGNGPRGTPESLHRDALPPRPRAPADWRRRYHAGAERARDRHWADAAVARAAHLMRENPPVAAVVSSGPPHMAHEAATRIAERWGVPFVMDLRDPWSLVERLPEWHASPWWYAEALRAERRAVARASLILTTTAPAAAALAARHPAAAGRVRALPNGVDDDPLPAVPPPGRFVIAYAGTIYLDRDPRPLLRGLARFVARRGLTPAQCTLEFMGEVRAYDGMRLEALAEDANVGAYVRLHPPGSRAAALRFLAGASVLVSLPQDSDLAIPAKVFEYLRFPAAVLALATPRSATGALLEGSAADVVAPGDIAGIAAALARRYDAYARGERPAPAARGLGLDRHALAATLFAELTTLIRADACAAS